MTSSKRGFTLIELMVVVGMIAIIIAAMSTAVASANERARVQKALAEVKVISQAILAYENFADGHELKTMEKAEADKSTIGFLLGGEQGAAAEGGQKHRIPSLLMASLAAGNKMRDPWGTPYRVTIREKTFSVRPGSASGSLKTGYFLPNWYRLSEGER